MVSQERLHRGWRRGFKTSHLSCTSPSTTRVYQLISSNCRLTQACRAALDTLRNLRFVARRGRTKPMSCAGSTHGVVERARGAAEYRVHRPLDFADSNRCNMAQEEETSVQPLPPYPVKIRRTVEAGRSSIKSGYGVIFAPTIISRILSCNRNPCYTTGRSERDVMFYPIIASQGSQPRDRSL